MKKIILLLFVFALYALCMHDVYAKTTTSLVKGTLRVKGKGAYNSLKYENNKKIKKIIIGKNVTQIGEYCFRNCKKLKKVIFNKKLKNIGHEAFMNTAITSVKLSKYTNVGDAAFYDCKKLKCITMKGKIKKYNRGDDEIGSIANKVKKVKYLTATNMYTLTHVNPNCYSVYKKDKKYISINGGVYKRKNYLCVVIPDVEEYRISEKSSVFDLDNIYHSIYNFDDLYYQTNYRLKKLVLPNSIAKIIYTKRTNYMTDQCYFKPKHIPEIVVENKKIDANSQKVLDDWLEERR